MTSTMTGRISFLTNASLEDMFAYMDKTGPLYDEGEEISPLPPLASNEVTTQPVANRSVRILDQSATSSSSTSILKNFPKINVSSSSTILGIIQEPNSKKVKVKAKARSVVQIAQPSVAQEQPSRCVNFRSYILTNGEKW